MIISCLSDRWGQITPLQKYALALDPRSKDLLSVKPEIRGHEGLEEKCTSVTQDVYDPLARFQRVVDLRSRIQDEISCWKGESSLKIRDWNVTQHRWDYNDVYGYWKIRSDKFPLLSRIAQQVFSFTYVHSTFIGTGNSRYFGSL